MPDGPLVGIVDELRRLKNSIDPDRFADAYRLIGDAMQAALDAGDPSIERSAIQWLRGAEQVNRGVGPFSDFIRAYTAEQYRLRHGEPASAEQLQDASDRIAGAVIDQIIDSQGRALRLADIGEHDIGGAADLIGDRAGWSGTLLFPILGNVQFFDELLVADPRDTYNMVAALHSALRALAGPGSGGGGFNPFGSSAGAAGGMTLDLADCMIQ